LITTFAGGICQVFLQLRFARTPENHCNAPDFPIATASTVIRTTTVPAFFKTSALAKQGSLTGPAARS